jgi:probable selenium-dependent hydroxylase accessory protein YqeC
MGHDQALGLPVLLSPSDAEIAAAEDLVVAWRVIDEPVALGVAPELCDRWFGLVDHVIVEADGARRHPFKAPGPNEPVVPATTTLVISVIGADALGQVINDRCHRPELVAELAGCRTDSVLSADAAARVLLHPRGYRASVPPGARLVLVVTKVSPQREAAAARLETAVYSRCGRYGAGGSAPAGPDPIAVFAITHH